MSSILKHSNGEQYLILNQSGDTTLLVEITDYPKFIVAYGLEGNSWQGASYWSSLHAAYSRFLEIILEGR